MNRAVELVDRGRAFRLESRLAEARACFEKALTIDPDYWRAHAGYAATLAKLGEPARAIGAYWESVRLKPEQPLVYDALGDLYLSQGKAERAVDCYRASLRLNPDDECTRSSLGYALNFDPRAEPEEVFRAHAEFGATLASTPRLDRLVSASGPRKLNIGYVSGDFCQHAVINFLEPILVHHSRDRFHLTLYSNTETPDDVTDRLSRYADRWRPVRELSDDEMATLVRQDGIDVLVDLSGHTNDHRLPVFARKPAPVQVTYLGYPNTTGLVAMDYRLTDACADPPGLADDVHTETLARLPHCFLCFRRPPEAPEVRPGPPGIVFGSCSKPQKWNDTVIAAWAAILRRVPNARLLLHHTGIGGHAGPRVFETFFAHGVTPERIEMQGRTSWRDHWAWFHGVHLALDPFPYNGTTATCETLWMGVPVVTLAGQTHVSRVGVSLLSAIGLTELIANSVEEYVDLAVKLAGEPDRLETFRRGMRDRMRSPLMDGAGFTRRLEDTYLAMWRRTL